MDTVCVRAWDPASLVPPPFFARLLFRQLKRAPPVCVLTKVAPLMQQGRERLGRAPLRCVCRLLLRYPAAPMNLRRTTTLHHRCTVPMNHCTTAC